MSSLKRKNSAYELAVMVAVEVVELAGWLVTRLSHGKPASQLASINLRFVPNQIEQSPPRLAHEHTNSHTIAIASNDNIIAGLFYEASRWCHWAHLCARL